MSSEKKYEDFCEDARLTDKGFYRLRRSKQRSFIWYLYVYFTHVRFFHGISGVFTVSEEVCNALLFDVYTFILHTYISFMVFREVLCWTEMEFKLVFLTVHRCFVSICKYLSALAARKITLRYMCIYRKHRLE